jgi:hypothetical protein
VGVQHHAPTAVTLGNSRQPLYKKQASTLLHNHHKIQETSKFYQLTKGNRREEVLVGRDMRVTYWHHPADTIIFLTESNETAGLIRIFTDGASHNRE